MNLIQKCAGTFVADMDEIRPAYSNVTDGGAVFSSSVVRSAGPSIGSTIDALDNSLVSAGQNKQLATPWYSDQVLPFDITLSGANEMGAMCAARIFGVEILNEGWGISINDAVSEMQATFVARVVEPMSAVASPFLFKTRSLRPAGNKNPRARAYEISLLYTSACCTSRAALVVHVSPFACSHLNQEGDGASFMSHHSNMKWFRNLLILAAGIPMIIGGLLALTVLSVGASGIVFARRLRNALAV